MIAESTLMVLPTHEVEEGDLFDTEFVQVPTLPLCADTGTASLENPLAGALHEMVEDHLPQSSTTVNPGGQALLLLLRGGGGEESGYIGGYSCEKVPVDVPEGAKGVS